LTDVSALSGLTALTWLDLSSCEQLTDVSALSGLTALASLDLNRCRQLTDVSALAGLTALTKLNLQGCCNLSFTPIRSLLDANLKDLHLYTAANVVKPINS
jgi:internalin A